MFKRKSAPSKMGLHSLPSAAMGSQAGQPPSKNPQPKPQAPKSVPKVANDTKGYQPKMR